MRFDVNAALFKKLVDAVKDLVGTSNLEFTEQGIELNAMDTSHVSLVYLNILDSLAKYEWDHQEILSINTETLSKVLKTCENDSMISCASTDTQLHITAFSNMKQSKFTVNLMDMENEKLTVEDQAYPCTIYMKTSEFHKVVKDLKEFGDSVTLQINPSRVGFITESCGECMQVFFENNDEFKLVTEASMELSFSTKYLVFFLQSLSID